MKASNSSPFFAAIIHALLEEIRFEVKMNEIPEALRKALVSDSGRMSMAFTRLLAATDLPPSFMPVRSNNAVAIGRAIARAIKQRCQVIGNPTSEMYMCSEALQVLGLAFGAQTDDDFEAVLRHHPLTSGLLPERLPACV
ncbi:MAG: hypothetical protein AAB515_00225 [Patescibacteria group bacterium]